MSYAERRKGKLSGRWVGEEVVRGHRYRQAFDTKPEADGYEAYVKATGQEPPHKDGAKHTGVTFAEVAALCRDAGGPRRGRWKAERTLVSCSAWTTWWPSWETWTSRL
jgi:hypothetical protein